jgi:hypothetical protein
MASWSDSEGRFGLIWAQKFSLRNKEVGLIKLEIGFVVSAPLGNA